jgi:4a-hydroxytetrahydrobiopterin dehydratase
MDLQSPQQLVSKKCKPCEGGVEPYSLEQSKSQLAKLPGWKLTPDGQRIRKDWTLRIFSQA